MLARHLLALSSLSGERFWTAHDVDDLREELASVSLDTLRAYFSRASVARVHRDVVEFCGEDGLSLALFFERLGRFWARDLTTTDVVLVLDQFEELFTRFIDQKLRGEVADAHAGDFTVREHYFKQLGELLAHQAQAEAASRGPGVSVKIVVSMRDDYIARIDELERCTGTIGGEARYHLRLLHTTDASSVVKEPARLFDFTYDDDVFEEIVAKLPTEEDQIEPGHIQVICERLWNHAGARRVPFTEFTEVLGGVRGILESHFTQFLEPFDEFEVLEILDLLEPLITLDRRRNIVQRERLIDAPFRKQERRVSLLEALRRRRLVRIEWRLGGAFVEVAHEFLIVPIEREIAARIRTQPRLRDLADAFRTLDRIGQEGFRTASLMVLTAPQLEAFLWYVAGRDARVIGDVSDVLCAHLLDVNTTPRSHAWLAEVLYRSAILRGATDVLPVCRTMCERLGENHDGPLLTPTLARRANQRVWLDAYELRQLFEEGPRNLPSGQQEFILRSAVLNGSAVPGIIGRWFARLGDATDGD